MSLLPEDHEIYTVSALNAESRNILESHYQSVWILGEISNLARPSSGHLYFSLKDTGASVRCAMFRMTRQRVKFAPENGQQVLIRAKVSLYEPRGDYQLIVSDMRLAGDGALQIAFEKLKNKLSKEGLFDEAQKRKLPEFPTQLGVVTSATGAALHDILKVLRRRFPGLPVIIYPSMVQGDTAAAQIVSAIKLANTRNECDVLLIARGGGSLEDLWPFNEEIVARAIFNSEIPTVTGIGHEVDFTIADFVADLRTATPSAAAETISPDQNEWLQTLNYYYGSIQKTIQQKIHQLKMHLSHVNKRLQHPGQRLQAHAQRLDRIEANLVHATKTVLREKTNRLSGLARTLNAINPLNTLERGYAIITDAKTQTVITDATQTKPGDTIHAKLAKGKLICEVKTST